MTHDLYMQRCLQLAKNGLGFVKSNPLVGCVIVKDNKIISEGFHQQFGGPHAEVNAINAVENKEWLKSSTLYVNLEPCAHFGKTPPCADLIIAHKIPRVVVAMQDPNELVAGKGIEKLKNAGVEVVLGICQTEAQNLNKTFVTFMTQKRPYIMLKWAQSANGFINAENIQKLKISNEQSLQLVHKWRSETMGILVGSQTIKDDNPKLTTRLVDGNNPTRIIISKNIDFDQNTNIFDSTSPTIIFNANYQASDKNLFFEKIDFSNNVIPQVLEHLHKKNIQSVMVEGGRYTLGQFIQQNLWDEALVFISQKNIAKGTEAPNINTNHLAQTFTIDDNKLFVYQNNSPLFF